MRKSWLRMLLSAACMLLVFEVTPLDLWLEDGYYRAGKFVGAGNWWLEVFSHLWVKWGVIGVAGLVWFKVIANWFAQRRDKGGVAGRASDGRRWLVVGLAMLLVPASVGALKHHSGMHCPWDLQRYGGDAPYVKLLDFTPIEPPGRCFPAGHATTGFALFAFALFWRGRQAGLARLAWWAAFSVGVALGWGQQMRGAHFLSHTLWSAWVSWAVCLLVYRALIQENESRAGRLKSDK